MGRSPLHDLPVPLALGGGFGLVLALAIRDQVSEALAAVLVLMLSLGYARHDDHQRRAQIRRTLAAELARNLDDSLPNLIAMRDGFAETVAGRLGRGEPLFFAYSPDEDISLKIYGPMIPSFDPDLAGRVMAYFDAEASACDLLTRLESAGFARLDAPRQAEWLLMTERVLDAAIAAGAAARERLAGLYGLEPPAHVAKALRERPAGSPAADHLIGQMMSQRSMREDMGRASAERQGNPGGAA